PIHLVSLPITTQKSFVYCIHDQEKTIDTSSPFTRVLSRLLGLGAKGWQKLCDSDLAINKKTVQYMKQLLHKIPYNEGSLRSIPSQALLKRTLQKDSAKDHLDEDSHKVLTALQIQSLPSEITANMADHFINLVDSLLSTDQMHLRKIVLCALGAPFTIPFGLIPVLPNIPLFWLMFRAWCHFEAFQGVRHLRFLKGTSKEESHLEVVKFDKLDECYHNGGANIEKFDGSEKVVLNERIIKELAEKLHAPKLEELLKVALAQEK
ncbi:hypothetical protein BABINDRAFT_17677, partial [Babjeviella inositovora NRRL Y-12698]